MVFNWPEYSERYKRVAKFVDALFGKLDQLREPSRHPKWRDTYPAATVPGLQRFKAADEWLTQHGLTATASSPEVRLKFDRFLTERRISAPNNVEQRDVLFHEFLEWQKAQDGAH
jgi:uncharacterized protein